MTSVDTKSDTSLHNCTPIKNAFSVDLEDYFHTQVAAKVVDYEAWDVMPSRIEHNTQVLLDLLESTETCATFFVLGWVARKQPALVRSIRDRGHEIACHSDRHRLIHALTPKEFLEDSRVARDAIADACGERVRGYRAPSFSINSDTGWAFDVLADLGFEYDSSINPIYHPTYGNAGSLRFPHLVASSKLLEIPIATWRIFWVNLPVGGGAYLRALPQCLIRAGVRSINRMERQAAMLYVHPWEIDPSSPRLKLKALSAARQTYGVRTMSSKLKLLLSQEQFGRIDKVYAHLLPSC